MIVQRIHLRLTLDTLSLGLLLIALAYYWLGNAVHEWVGSCVFLLAIVHNVFNRRWYGKIPLERRETRGLINILVTFSLLIAMFSLVVTSLLISTTVFPAFALDDIVNARRIHVLAAYWVLVVVSVHIGLRWSMIMSIARDLFAIRMPNAARAGALRLAALLVAAGGVLSSIELGMGSKLSLKVTMDFWDFEESAPGFFLRQLAIVGLYAVLGHYTMALIRLHARRRAGRIP